MALRRTAGRGQDSGHISIENPTAVTIDSGRGDDKQINLIISTLAYVILGIVQPNPSDLRMPPSSTRVTAHFPGDMERSNAIWTRVECVLLPSIRLARIVSNSSDAQSEVTGLFRVSHHYSSLCLWVGGGSGAGFCRLQDI